MYLWYYSTRAFARNSFHATRPEIHGARQICIQSYNINNVFLHFIISRRIHATFCTMVVFIPAALYSETSGLQPIKYAVRPVFWNILIIFSICWSVLGSTADKIRRETRNFTISGSHGVFFASSAQKPWIYPSFSLLSSGFGVSRSYFSSVDPRQPSPGFLTNVFCNKNMPRHIFAPSAVACGMSLLRTSAHPARRAKSTLSSVFLYRNIPHPDIFFIM